MKLYSRNGEWIRPLGSDYQVGLSAQSLADLGEVSFIEIPAVGRQVFPGEAVCAIEAAKAAIDFYSPLEGVISEVNTRLQTEPELINQSPEEEAWLFRVTPGQTPSLEEFLDEPAWKAWIGQA